jgi:hypothetical protein
MPFGGIQIDSRHLLLGYDQQTGTTLDPWQRLVLFWQISSSEPNSADARRCFQVWSTLDVSRYDRQRLSSAVRLLPSPRSNFEPVSLSRVFERESPSLAQLVLYSLRSSVPEADVTITVRPSAADGQHFADLNNSLQMLAVADNAPNASAGQITARYAARLPDDADQAEVMLTVHHTPEPISIDNILVAQIPMPDDQNTTCLDMMP